MGRKKRVYEIMKLTDECNQKLKDGKTDIVYDYDIHTWNAKCIADYFFMEYFPNDASDKFDKFYRQNTCLTVLYHKRKRRVRNNGIYLLEDVYDEIYIVSKLDTFGGFVEVYRTQNMNELAELFQMFNEYQSVAWWTYYEAFINSFNMLWN